MIDLKAYLERIGHTGKCVPTLEVLRQLHLACGHPALDGDNRSGLDDPEPGPG